MFGWEKNAWILQALHFIQRAKFKYIYIHKIYSYFHLLIDSSQGEWMQQGDYENKALRPKVGYYYFYYYFFPLRI